MQPDEIEGLVNICNEVSTHITQATTILSEEASTYQMRNGQEFVENEETLAADVLAELQEAKQLLEEAISELENYV